MTPKIELVLSGWGETLPQSHISFEKEMKSAPDDMRDHIFHSLVIPERRRVYWSLPHPQRERRPRRRRRRDEDDARGREEERQRRRGWQRRGRRVDLKVSRCCRLRKKGLLSVTKLADFVGNSERELFFGILAYWSYLSKDVAGDARVKALVGRVHLFYDVNVGVSGGWGSLKVGKEGTQICQS